MDEATVRMQAQMYALIAHKDALLVYAEGMKALNAERENRGHALAYDEAAFIATAKELEAIAQKLREDI